MDNQVINLITFKLFVADFEMIFGYNAPLTDWDIPDRNASNRVANKEAARIIKNKAIRVNFVKDTSVYCRFYF